MSIFNDHPHSIGETYSQHLLFAVSTGGKLIGAGLAVTIHGLFPFWHQTTASRVIKDLYHLVTARVPVPANVVVPQTEPERIQSHG